jgi:hypothetical protein
LAAVRTDADPHRLSLALRGTARLGLVFALLIAVGMAAGRQPAAGVEAGERGSLDQDAATVTIVRGGVAEIGCVGNVCRKEHSVL